MAEIARNYTLITIDGVRELLVDGTPFKCRYEFVGLASDNAPKYHCIYSHQGSDAILVRSKIGRTGAEAREFNLWPGLFKHHHEFGDGTSLCIAPDWKITCTP